MIWPEPRRQEDLWMGFVSKGRNKYQSGGLQHLKIRQIREEVGEEVFDGCYKFALIRNPVDRIVSQFNYLNKREDLLGLLELDRFRTFSQYLSHIQEVEHVQWTPQVDFLENQQGVIVPELFRLEELSDKFERLAIKTGLKVVTPLHSNKSLDSSVPPDWVIIRKENINKNDLETIRKIYAQDFDRLSYCV